jgi:hypothetical protein
MNRSVAIVLLAAAQLLVPAASRAAEAEKAPSELAIEGVAKLLDALELFIDSIPRYEAPYIDGDGDIVIPRKPAPEARPPERQPGQPESAPHSAWI